MNIVEMFLKDPLFAFAFLFIIIGWIGSLLIYWFGDRDE